MWIESINTPSAGLTLIGPRLQAQFENQEVVQLNWTGTVIHGEWFCPETGAAFYVIESEGTFRLVYLRPGLHNDRAERVDRKTSAVEVTSRLGFPGPQMPDTTEESDALIASMRSTIRRALNLADGVPA